MLPGARALCSGRSRKTGWRHRAEGRREGAGVGRSADAATEGGMHWRGALRTQGRWHRPGKACACS
eukprot:13269754-Alexandrium_andersonii.AAC.1